MSELAPRRAALYELVNAIPSGRVSTYGDLARALGIGSARLVGQMMAGAGDSVAWHRVVRADGTLPEHLAGLQASLLADEGVEVRDARVRIAALRWQPPSQSAGAERRP